MQRAIALRRETGRNEFAVGHSRSSGPVAASNMAWAMRRAASSEMLQRGSGTGEDV
jgi:hypothetical protein